MAFIRCFLMAVILLFCMPTKAQTIYYPAGASQLLKETAADMAGLLQRATGSATIAVQPYSAPPPSGIVLIYDSTITGNQTCKINGNGNGYLSFAAAQDNGLVFGVYQYLYQLGFRFYQPGEAWQVIPNLITPFVSIQTTVTGRYKYRSWVISGGHSRWVMDNNNTYYWDVYFGENGHNWALYQRRNGMNGAHRFAGHRTDIISGNYLTTLQNNPCYVACYNGSRQAGMQSVPDINSNSAIQLWANAITQQYAQYRNTIYGNPLLYANQYRNFAYNNQLIGLEAPDGAQWGNSTDNLNCSGIYPTASDQQFTLANAAVMQVCTQFPTATFQCYAYSSHANVPANHIDINSRLDVQVIPTAFQTESSSKGLMNRWYNRHNNVSEYHYLNIPQWGGETPMQSKTELEQTLDRLQEKNSQGIVWEASPAKFSSLPYLLAANRKLQQDISVDSTLREFCNTLFGPAASNVYTLLQLWGDEKAITTGDYMPDNKYKLPLYLNLVNKAAQQAASAPALVQERIAELKAYLHYMVLYYDWLNDQRSHTAKAQKAAALCLYLATVHKLQIVNSYFLIADISSRYPVGSTFYTQYNPTNGTAYLNGSLPLITRNTIEQNFATDMAVYGNQVQQYQLLDSRTIKAKMVNNNVAPAQKIAVKIGYTNGYEYAGRAEFWLEAPTAGNFTVQYTPRFDAPDNGYVNFTVEAADKALNIVKDITLPRGTMQGSFTVNLPAAGTYKLSVNTRFKAAVDIVIATNDNLFYKSNAFLGNKTENYRGSLSSLPGYFYVPEGMDRVYFSINNANPGGAGFARLEDINKAFAFKDHDGNSINAMLASTEDSALYYLPVPAGAGGHFWQALKMEQYNLCFANISNLLWYGRRKACGNASFTANVINYNGQCVTELKTNNNNNIQWEVYDANKWVYYTTPTIELPAYVSPNAIVILKTGTGCFTMQRLGDDEQYMRLLENCATGAPLPEVAKGKPVLYPNPTTGIVNCMRGGIMTAFNDMSITNALGRQVATIKTAYQFNIGHLPAGIYLYTCTINGQLHKGRLVKL